MVATPRGAGRRALHGDDETRRVYAGRGDRGHQGRNGVHRRGSPGEYRNRAADHWRIPTGRRAATPNAGARVRRQAPPHTLRNDGRACTSVLMCTRPSLPVCEPWKPMYFLASFS